MPIKRQVFTSLVRSKMEYASSVWYCNSSQLKRLESIQHLAATWMLRANSHSSQTALRTILKLPRLESRRKMMRLFYAATLLSKPHSTWARHCFEVIPSSTNRVRGISQTHWATRCDELVRNSDILKQAYLELTGYLANAGGVLPERVVKYVDTWQETVTFPETDWRHSVRCDMVTEELRRLDEESEYMPTLRLLKAALPSSLFSEYQRVLTCTPSATNWIRMRLLAGTSALNYTMSRIARTRQGSRTSRCPMCGDVESVVHFLRECTSLTAIGARASHQELMPPLFSTLDDFGQAAFILGVRVSQQTLEHGIRPSRVEDAANIILVRNLWKHRCETLDNHPPSDGSPSPPSSPPLFQFSLSPSSPPPPPPPLPVPPPPPVPFHHLVPLPLDAKSWGRAEAHGLLATPR